MYEFHPYYTNDGSVGLYNSNYNDIYHSAKGALTEAYEKFIMPINFDFLMSKDEVKVLDICYGIGYNSKSFLNFIFKNYFQKNFSKKSFGTKKNIATIHTNNIYQEQHGITQPNTDICNGAIYTHNILPKISITAIDTDKILACLSPFIKTGEKRFNNENLDFEYNINKYFVSKQQINTENKIDNLINFFIFEKLFKACPKSYEDKELIEILNKQQYKPYFNSNLKGIFEYYINKQGKSSSELLKCSFLHNIYYRHVSNSYKNSLKRYKLQDINFHLKIDDARTAILEDFNTYDLIFLDAFTPSKCPCLWSYEFFCELFKHLNEDGMLLTYSSSASIRGAMLAAGFYIGNIYNERENKFIGTIAVKNNNLIKYPLSEFDLGLLKTRAGIFYRDKNLRGQNEAIIELRNLEVKNSSRITSSQYKKNYKETL